MNLGGNGRAGSVASIKSGLDFRRTNTYKNKSLLHAFGRCQGV